MMEDYSEVVISDLRDRFVVFELFGPKCCQVLNGALRAVDCPEVSLVLNLSLVYEGCGDIEKFCRSGRHLGKYKHRHRSQEAPSLAVKYMTPDLSAYSITSV